MVLWKKVVQKLFKHASVATYGIDDDKLILQINNATKEIAALVNDRNGYIDPSYLDTFIKKWQPTCSAAKRRALSMSFLLGLCKKDIKTAVPLFIKQYDNLFNDINSHNEKFTAERIANAEKLILPVENKQLDKQQMYCIVKEARNHLVLAGAGTGKTTTIVGYAKYLLKTSAYQAADLLILSFTNASAYEMSTRLKEELKTDITASTFHKLGLDIITSVQGKRPKVFSGDMRNYVRDKLNVLINDPSYLRKLCFYLVFGTKEQNEDFAFKNLQEYNDFLKYNPPITLKGETVKSYGELDIANFLYENGIEYEYEKEYPVDTRTEEFSQYYPDFYLPYYNIYIEYYGVDRAGNVPSYFLGRNGMTPSQTYQSGIQWKRNLHHKYGTTVIETFAYERSEGHLLSHLEELLKNAGVRFDPLSTEELWDSIKGSSSQKLDRIAELFATVITLIKSNNCTFDSVHERCKKIDYLIGADELLSMIEPIYEEYSAELRQNDEIDFNDMINLAAEYVQNGSYVHHFGAIIIDEYQDISQSRFRLVDAMRKQKDFRLFCVGDDWQSIYRFSGSDIGFILNFEKYWGPSEISYIETTYRFPQSLISVSSEFIMKNPEQKRKNLKSAVVDRGFAMEQIKVPEETRVADKIAERLKRLPDGSTVYFLGRYRFDFKLLEKSNSFYSWYDIPTGKTNIVYKQRPDLCISFMTIHSSKGLQADYVFLLNNKGFGMGFPSHISDAPILRALLDNCDHYPYAEERRLFYVAITRAKRKVFLVTLYKNRSIFVNELDTIYGEAMRREQYSCPICGGRLVRRSGPTGEFYGCSNYGKTGCRYTRPISS